MRQISSIQKYQSCYLIVTPHISLSSLDPEPFILSVAWDTTQERTLFYELHIPAGDFNDDKEQRKK
jgi:hypothetical protein